MKLTTIGALTLVGQACIDKVLWAPLLDRVNPLGSLGRRRSWIMLMQLGLAIALAWMAFLTPNKTPWVLASVALIVVFNIGLGSHSWALVASQAYPELDQEILPIILASTVVFEITGPILKRKALIQVGEAKL